jgi:hypothetical protein
METKSVAEDFPVVCVGDSAGGLDACTREHAPGRRTSKHGQRHSVRTPLKARYLLLIRLFQLTKQYWGQHSASGLGTSVAPRIC